MSDNSPVFYGWCEDAVVVDAFAAALAALAVPNVPCSVSFDMLGRSDGPERNAVSCAQVMESVRQTFTASTVASASLLVAPPLGKPLPFDLECIGAEYERRYPHGSLSGAPWDSRDLVVQRIDVAVSTAPRSVVVEAALLAIQVTTNIEDILFRLCAPDDHARVTTGACSLGCWDAPVEISATYHAEAAHIARDLALSWLELHEGARVPSTAGLSMEALRSRVEAAPPGARVGVARHVEGLHERWRQWKAAEEAAKQAHVPRPPRDGRKIAPGHDELTREHVLAALSTSPATLLEALEAAAVADEEWRAVEPIALETIEATKRGAPTYDVDVTTRKHVQFVQQHAPFRVRRLPNGGVMLATHPHRILWPLWADALQLLGVR